MALLCNILFVLFALIGFVAYLFVLYAAFRDEIWKGCLCLLCQIYGIYYVFTESDNLYIYQIPVGWVWLGCSVLAAVFHFLARAFS